LVAQELEEQQHKVLDRVVMVETLYLAHIQQLAAVEVEEKMEMVELVVLAVAQDVKDLLEELVHLDKEIMVVQDILELMQAQVVEEDMDLLDRMD
jgi:hypothetical protein